MTKPIKTLALIATLIAPMAQAQTFVWDLSLSFPGTHSTTKSTKSAETTLPTPK